MSAALISNVTEAVLEEVKTWQGRPLETVYPIVYLDAALHCLGDHLKTGHA